MSVPGFGVNFCPECGTSKYLVAKGSDVHSEVLKLKAELAARQAALLKERNTDKDKTIAELATQVAELTCELATARGPSWIQSKAARQKVALRTLEEKVRRLGGKPYSDPYASEHD